jgi:hypothetical protein
MLIDLNTGDSISVDATPWIKRPALTTWTGVISRPTANGITTKILGQREISIANEPILCIEQDVDLKPIHLYPTQCRSTRSLEITFQPLPQSGKSHDAMFYSLLQQLQKP